MKMTARGGWLLVSVLASAIVAGCASGGGAPRPQPFPGADRPPPASAGRPLRPPISSRRRWPSEGLRTGTAEASRRAGSIAAASYSGSSLSTGRAFPAKRVRSTDEGKKLDRDDVQAGDLVFFETVSRGPSHVGHRAGGRPVRPRTELTRCRASGELYERLLGVAMGRRAAAR